MGRFSFPYKAVPIAFIGLLKKQVLIIRYKLFSAGSALRNLFHTSWYPRKTVVKFLKLWKLSNLYPRNSNKLDGKVYSLCQFGRITLTIAKFSKLWKLLNYGKLYIYLCVSSWRLWRSNLDNSHKILKKCYS